MKATAVDGEVLMAKGSLCPSANPAGSVKGESK